MTVTETLYRSDGAKVALCSGVVAKCTGNFAEKARNFTFFRKRFLKKFV